MKVLAIVIGNSNYFDPDKLKNAVGDAKAIEEVFLRLGYNVVSGYDCNNKKHEELLRTLDTELVKYDASIFYYAGHGFQEEEENYLPSIECQVSYTDRFNLGDNSIKLDQLLGIYRKYSNKTNIVILDACRKRASMRGGGDSFAPMDAPSGTLIAFSTSPNCGAKDTPDAEHSVYCQALLNYIGRENMMVEELFKRVRRSVALWTQNQQIPWEHTSLISDFRFNTGQLVASPQIPYSENVVRDSEYDEVGEIATLIGEIRISDYNRQNPAIDKLWAKKASDLDKNQQFIFGRNLLQASSMSFSAQRFMNSLVVNLRKYQTSDGDNHVLNGILFEIYFDCHGEFRETEIKRQSFEEVMALRKQPEFTKSFVFIRTVLVPYRDSLIYMIPEDDAKLDVELMVHEENVKNYFGEELYSIISLISVNGKDITDSVHRRFERSGRTLKEAIALVAKAPIDAISIHPNMPLQQLIAFDKKLDDDSFLNLTI